MKRPNKWFNFNKIFTANGWTSVEHSFQAVLTAIQKLANFEEDKFDRIFKFIFGIFEQFIFDVIIGPIQS